MISRYYIPNNIMYPFSTFTIHLWYFNTLLTLLSLLSFQLLITITITTAATAATATATTTTTAAAAAAATTTTTATTSTAVTTTTTTTATTYTTTTVGNIKGRRGLCLRYPLIHQRVLSPRTLNQVPKYPVPNTWSSEAQPFCNDG